MKIVKAETSNSQEGTLTIIQTYLIDASEDFLGYTDGFTNDEKIEAGQDMDYINLKDSEVESKLWNLIRGTNSIDYTINNINTTLYNNPKPETAEQALEYSKKIQIQLDIEILYSLDDNASTELEKNVLLAVKSVNPKAIKDEE